jgi:serine/threonine-protein kinase
MGEVYRARDTRLERPVALKVLPAEIAHSPEFQERLKREARAAAALRHPNVVSLYSLEESGGRHFITMELVEGELLKDVIPAAGLEFGRLLDFGLSSSMPWPRPTRTA